MPELTVVLATMAAVWMGGIALLVVAWVVLTGAKRRDT